MNDLPDFVLDAHIGLKRWSGVSTLTTKLAAGGPFWGRQGFPDAFGDETLTVDVRRQHAAFTPWTAPGKRDAVLVDPAADHRPGTRPRRLGRRPRQKPDGGLHHPVDEPVRITTVRLWHQRPDQQLACRPGGYSRAACRPAATFRVGSRLAGPLSRGHRQPSLAAFRTQCRSG